MMFLEVEAGRVNGPFWLRSVIPIWFTLQAGVINKL